MIQLPQESLPSVKDALDFIYEHPASRLKKWDREQMALAIYESIKENSILYATKDGRIITLSIGKFFEKRYHIVAFQSIDSAGTAECIYRYLVNLARNHPVVTAHRKGILKRYYPIKLLWATILYKGNRTLAL